MKTDIQTIYNSAYESTIELIGAGDIQLVGEQKSEEYAKTMAELVIERLIKKEKGGYTILDENLESLVDFGPLDNIPELDKSLRGFTTTVIPSFENEFGDVPSMHAPVVSDFLPISEMDIEEGGKRARVTLIESGWSNNGNYYSPSVLKQLVPLIESQRKIYVDHKIQQQNGGVTVNRGMMAWGATIESVIFVKDGGRSRIDAVLNFEGAPAGEIMRNASKHFPEEVGLSIATIARVTTGKREGKTGRIVEAWVKYFSTDFVNNPSAGGVVQTIFASEFESDLSIINYIVEAFHSLGDVFDDIKERDNFFTLMNLFTGLLIETSRTSDVSDAEKKKHINQLVVEFADKLKTIDMNRAFPSFEEEVEESETEEEIMKISEATLTVLENQNPSVVKAIEERAISNYESAQNIGETKDDLETAKETLSGVETKLEETDKELKEIKETLDTVEKDKADAEAKLAGFEEAQVKEAKEETINKLLGESKFPGGADKFPEFYMKGLLELKTEEEIKTAIDEASNLALLGTGKITGNNSEEVSETPSGNEIDVTEDDSAAVNILTAENN